MIVEKNVSRGEIVQLHPEKCRNLMFAASLLVVDEVKSWGVQGYVQALGENGETGGQAWYRAHWEEFERTGGTAVWIPGPSVGNEGSVD